MCAVALVRVVVGNPLIVNDLSQVTPPPAGYDSVVLLETEKDGTPPKTDSIFSFSDFAVQPEYIVLFSHTAGGSMQAQHQQPQMVMQMPQFQQQPQQQMYSHLPQMQFAYAAAQGTDYPAEYY